ncbi:MAG: hypothetical protein ACJA08_000833 [Cyclobacteriaceae bacterium]|jgi:hypothetical protein
MIRLVALVFLSISSLVARSSELDSLIALLDNEIKNKSRYEQIKKNRIDAIFSFLKKPGLDTLERFRYNKLLIAEYEKYSFDSTILYIEGNLKIAGELGRQELINESLVSLGANLSSVGRSKEAVDVLTKVDTTLLNKDQQIRFNNIQRKLFEDLCYYASSDNCPKHGYEMSKT